MTATRILSLFTATALLAGCATNKQQETDTMQSAAASPEKIAEIRAMYQAAAPDARVGIVNAVLPDQMLASITDVPVDDFGSGAAVSFMDSAQQVVANGRVVNVVGSDVHVRYEPAGRAPQVGDLGITFIQR